MLCGNGFGIVHRLLNVKSQMNPSIMSIFYRNFSGNLNRRDYA
jgi:hypothetical protein